MANVACCVVWAALLSAVALISHTLYALLFSKRNRISPTNRSVCNAHRTESLVPNGSIRIRVSLHPIYIYIRGVTVHKYDGSVRTLILTSWFGMISVQQGEKLNFSFFFF